MNRSWKLICAVFIVLVVGVTGGCRQAAVEDTPTPAPTDTPMQPAAAPSATPTAVSPPASMAISPSSGPPGTEVEIAAAGFQPEEEVELRVGQVGTEYVIASTGLADADGLLTTSLIVPTSAEAGEEWVVVASAVDGETEAVSNIFEVTAAEYDPQVSIKPTTGPPRTEVEVVAEGFPPGAAAQIGVGREDSEFDVVKTVDLGGEGSISTLVAIPGYAEAGERWVVVVQTDDPVIRGVSNVFAVTEEEHEGSVAISPLSGPPGTTVDVAARGFPPNTAVEIGVGRVDSEYDVVARAQTDADGRVDTQIVIPGFVEPEDAWVIVVAAEDRPVKAVSDVFDVTPVTTPTPPTPTPSGNLFTRANIYLIAVGDEGESGREIGCGDSVVPVEVAIEPTIAPLRAALNSLLSLNTREYGQSGLYNALYRSDLTIEDINIVNREAVIRLSGELVLGGVCDEPRVQAQLREIALQYATVDRVSIFINGTPLDEVLSAATPTPEDDLFTQTDIYLIAVGDEGESGREIGCGDSVVPVEVEIEPTIAPLTAALKRLLSLGTREYGLSGFYNALYRSDLTVDDVDIENGEAIIRLSGQLTVGGVCDGPRIRAQLRETALQYGTVDQVSILINGTPLDDLLDQG
jgi:hypothetical protein